MTARRSGLMLALAILICPLLCGADACCRPARAADQHCSCCCHEEAPANPVEERCPEAPNESSGDGCQCICGGALTLEATTVALARQLEFVGVFILVDAAQPPHYGEVHSLPYPDIGWHPSGRDLCALHMLLQC